MDSPRYLALIGKSTELAASELSAVLNRTGASAKDFYAPYFYEIIGDINPQQLVSELGGTVKIYRIVDGEIADKLIQDNQDHFCLSSIKHSYDMTTVAKDVKQKLKDGGLKPHFRLLENPFYSAGITTKYAEFTFIPNEEEVIAAEAVAVQNLNYWTQKDYGRPAFDPSSGMLPPKVARMMINIAIPNSYNSNTTIYDPMCGSGTILIEGLDLGVKVIGSDLAKKAVEASSTNATWFINKYKADGQSKVFLEDATHVTLAQTGSQVDAIVFEGYLGPPHPTDKDTGNLIKGLEKLYKGVFKNLYPILKDGGYLVCALPEYHSQSGVKNLDSLVDWTSVLGYTRHTRFTYARQHAFTQRAIYVLQKTKN
jgi:tRNA G10  N-methylase Trm11